MPYLIYARDFDNKSELREGLREAHRSRLRAQGKKLLASGALLDNDGKTVIGDISLLDTEDPKEAEAFANEDPFAKAGIRQETQILQWRRRWWNGSFLESIS
jgi:uncharacterized protein YciI